jgi:hypothetical protein
MRRRFVWFTGEREAKWLVVLYVLLPLILIPFAIDPRNSEASVSLTFAMLSAVTGSIS